MRLPKLYDLNELLTPVRYCKQSVGALKIYIISIGFSRVYLQIMLSLMAGTSFYASSNLAWQGMR